MEFSLDEASKIFQEVSIPSLESVYVDYNDKKHSVLRLLWHQNDHVSLSKKKFSTIYKLEPEKSQFESLGFPVEVNSEIILECLSPSKTQKAVMKKSNDKNKNTSYLLEIWSDMRLKTTVNLSHFNKHGTVHSDLFFSSFSWDKTEEKLMYVAEQKKPMLKSFFETNSLFEDNDDSKNSTCDKYVYNESWGELIYDIVSPVICVYNIVKKKLYTLDCPETSGLSLAQPQWGPQSSIITSGYKNTPFKLGKFYCENRECDIYMLKYSEDFQVESICNLTQDLCGNNHCPRINKDSSKMVFMHNALAETGNPHGTDSELYCYNFASNKLSKIDSDSMFITNFGNSIWFDDNIHIAFQAKRDALSHIIIMNTDSGNVIKSDNGCFKLFGVTDSYAIWCSSIIGTDEMILVVYQHDQENGNFIRHQVKPIEFTLKIDYTKISINEAPNICSWAVYPQNNSTEKIPLIVWAHGGPHGVFTIDFDPFVSAFCKLGFAVLLINYTGSTSFTKKSLLELPGNIGTKDVTEVQATVLMCIKRFRGKFDEKNIFYFGGSHGGFLGAHLVGQYPDFYRAAVLRNPVIEISSMAMSSDIPDWCYFETGLDYDQGKVPNEADFSTMLAKSPIRYVKNINAPILIFVGEKDARVPPSQGKSFYKILKGNGKTVKLISYPDGSHPLQNVNVQGDYFMNTLKWFYEHYKR